MTSHLRLLLLLALMSPVAAQAQDQNDDAQRKARQEALRKAAAERAKTPYKHLADLKHPMKIEQLGVEHPEGPLKKTGAVRVRLTNPNSYNVVFFALQHQGQLTIGDSHYSKDGARWIWRARPPVGTNGDMVILGPGKSVEVLAPLLPDAKEQRIYTIFRKGLERTTYTNTLVVTLPKP